MFSRGFHICHAGCRAFLQSAKHVPAKFHQKMIISARFARIFTVHTRSPHSTLNRFACPCCTCCHGLWSELRRITTTTVCKWKVCDWSEHLGFDGLLGNDVPVRPARHKYDAAKKNTVLNQKGRHITRDAWVKRRAGNA